MADVRALRPDSLSAVVEIALQRHDVTSGRALARKAAELGLDISYTTINNLRRANYLHPLGREQRTVLARLSGVPLRIVNELAGAPDLAPFALPERADELTGDQRNAVLGVVGAFIAANDALAKAQGATTSEEGIPWAAMEDPPPGRIRSRPGESEEPWTER